MTRERLYEIFEETKSNWNGDNAFQGMQILSKYHTNLLRVAEHDIIYSVDINDVLETITEEDAIALSRLNWGIDKEFDCFYCFV